jgi:hypothetical protein
MVHVAATTRALSRVAAAALAMAALVTAVGCGRANADRQPSAVAWDGVPLVAQHPELPGDRIATGRLRNSSAEELRLEAADARLVDASGKGLRATVIFAAGVTHSLYPPRDAPRETPRKQQERLGFAATIAPGASVPVTVAWHASDGVATRIELGPGSLELPAAPTVLVAERRAEGAQLSRFAARLEPHLGLRPDLPNLPALIAALYALAEKEKTLVIIDEFPYLLPTRKEPRDEVLTAMQAVMEERESSQLKWWGKALNQLRRSKERQTEEVDVVGVQRGVVTIVGECKWTNSALTAQVLGDLETYKIPAMRQAKIRFPRKGPLIVLFSKSGFKQNLIDIAATRDDVRLVEVDELVDDLLHPVTR